jgi:hypothetical protein
MCAAKLTKEQIDGLAKLMREHVKLQADNLMLKKILSREHEQGKAVTDWRVSFTLLQQSPEYLRMIDQGETDIAQVLAEAGRNEVISEFLKNPPDGPAN